MLASGCAASWNMENPLCAHLAARALIESVALLRELDWQLEERITAEDLEDIDALLMNRLFASRDEEFTANHEFAQAINILTMIKKWDKRELPGVWRHYEMMSERCHPNALGHRQFFGMLDTATGAITYSDSCNTDQNRDYILGGALLLGFAESCIKRLDVHIASVADLQHKLNPVGGCEEH
jgi:hypothetical protein